MQERRGEDGRPASEMVEAARYAHLGLQLALSTVLFLFAGWWLDGKIGSTPVLTILGALFGAAAGFTSMYVHLVVEPRRRGEAARGDDTETTD